MKIIFKFALPIGILFLLNLSFAQTTPENITTEKTSFSKETVDPRLEIGENYLKKGDWQEAVKQFNNIISDDSVNVGAYFNLGCAYALLGEYDRALEAFRSSVTFEKEPFNAFSYFNIAGVYTKKALINITRKNFEGAIANFKEAESNYRNAYLYLPNFTLAIDYADTASGFSGSSVDSFSGFNTKVIFSTLEEGYPLDTAIFTREEDRMGRGRFKSYLFHSDTSPMLFFWHSPTTKAWIALSYAQQGKYGEASQAFEEMLKELSGGEQTRFNKLIQRGALITLSQIYLRLPDKNLILEKEEWVLAEFKKLDIDSIQEDAISSLICLLKGDYVGSEGLVKKVLLQDSGNNLAKDVLDSLKVLREENKE